MVPAHGQDEAQVTDDRRRQPVSAPPQLSPGRIASRNKVLKATLVLCLAMFLLEIFEAISNQDRLDEILGRKERKIDEPTDRQGDDDQQSGHLTLLSSQERQQPGAGADENLTRSTATINATQSSWSSHLPSESTQPQSKHPKTIGTRNNNTDSKVDETMAFTATNGSSPSFYYTIWSTSPEAGAMPTETLFLTRVHVATDLHEAIDATNVRIQQCYDGHKPRPKSLSPTIPPCPHHDSDDKSNDADSKVGTTKKQKEPSESSQYKVFNVRAVGARTFSVHTITHTTRSDPSDQDASSPGEITRIIPSTDILPGKVCRSPDFDCPKACPSNMLWDKDDLLCKSIDPSDLPPTRRWGGACDCKRTCYTPGASSSNSTWPWTSAEEKDFFYGQRKNESVAYACRKERKLEHLPIPRFVCSKAGSLELQCKHLESFENHFFFIPKAKLLFCGIPKVGITEWQKFLRYTLGARDYLSIPHMKFDKDIFTLRKLSLKKAQSLMNDPSWTKAVFFRDPATRLLSAYLNKVAGKPTGRTQFQKFKFEGPAPTNITFETFVDLVTMENQGCGAVGAQFCSDPHWRPQTLTCGIDYLLPHFDFIGNINYGAEHTKLLLERSKVWDTLGKTFDNGVGTESQRRGARCYYEPPDRFRGSNFTPVGFNQQDGGSAHHATSANSKLEQYYSKEMLEKVKKAYSLDYMIWDEIKDRDVNDVPNGRDLRTVQNFCTSK